LSASEIGHAAVPAQDTITCFAAEWRFGKRRAARSGCKTVICPAITAGFTVAGSRREPGGMQRMLQVATATRLMRGGAFTAVAILVGIAGLSAARPVRAAECPSDWISAEARTVVDARAILLHDERIVRLAGIEPFSLLRPGLGEAVSQLERRMRAALTGRRLGIHLTSGEADRHGRFPALVALEDGTLLQELVAREGLAVAFATGEEIPCFERILAAEDEARRAGRGFWTRFELPWARPERLAPFIGGFTIFEGLVVSVGNRRTRTYLNFGGRWTEDVTVEIEARDRERFGGESGLAALSGWRVRVRGYVEERRGPAILLRSPLQIEKLARVDAAPTTP
jgi:endonuclease YncB( thermonuclease family)